MNEEYVLQLQHISKEYPGVQALKDVSLEVKKGEILALIGENGAGKSTLINCITGIIKYLMEFKNEEENKIYRFILWTWWI